VQAETEGAGEGTIHVEREVRFGVVMYGGVSLAIYINGVAQELFQLSLATAQNTAPGSEHLLLEPAPAGTAAVYRQLARLLSLPAQHLREVDRALRAGAQALPLLQQAGPIRLKFVVDTISGSSAGGINGAFLGKALANNLDLAGLQKLWVEQGDILKLINDDHSIDASTPGLSAAKKPQALLNGQRMLQQLLAALDGMDRAAPCASPPSATGTARPVRSGHVSELDVFLTTTDVRGLPVGLRLADGLVTEYEHRRVFSFRYRDYSDQPAAPAGEVSNDFTHGCNAVLAFAARCTSSFPFAFEPVTLEGLMAMGPALPPEHRAAIRQAPERWQRWMPVAPLALAGQAIAAEDRQAAERDARTRPFCDGGYLDNKPFSYAVEALVSRVVEHPVQRKLLYVEPRPEMEATRAHRGTPDAVENVVLALTLAGYEAIREDLERVLQRNLLVERAERLLSGLDSDLQQARAERASATEQRFLSGGLQTMLDAFGAGYGGYHRLKVGALTDEIAQWVASAAGIDARSGLFAAVRLLVRVWRKRFFPIEPPAEPVAGVRSENQLLSFRARRNCACIGKRPGKKTQRPGTSSGAWRKPPRQTCRRSCWTKRRKPTRSQHWMSFATACASNSSA
jgi:patatin-related protein